MAFWGDMLRALLLGIVEGVTEWLPVSSTGHLILLRDVLRLPMREPVAELFEVVIQCGAILAVGVLFFDTLWPFLRRRDRAARRACLSLWGKIALAMLPAVVLGPVYDAVVGQALFRAPVVAGALVVYGVLFLVVERRRRGRELPGGRGVDFSFRTAFFIGCFQVLAFVPGTSRSGATILGAMLLGVSRPAAAEFSFFLGIPTMAGAGLLKTLRFFAAGERLTGPEAALLAVGTGTAFLVSLVTIRMLTDFVRRHSFAGFGVYRILLGCAVLVSALVGS